jgi:hypothetical protein
MRLGLTIDKDAGLVSSEQNGQRTTPASRPNDGPDEWIIYGAIR